MQGGGESTRSIISSLSEVSTLNPRIMSRLATHGSTWMRLLKKATSYLALTITPLVIASCDGTSSNRICQKTTSGKKLCIDKENVDCTRWENSLGRGFTIDCIANGVSTDLAGDKSHWSSNEDSQSWKSGKVTCYYSVDYRDALGFPAGKKGPDSLTCNAARHFNKVAKEITHDEDMQFALHLGDSARRDESVVICFNYELSEPLVFTFALDGNRLYLLEEMKDDGSVSRKEWVNFRHTEEYEGKEGARVREQGTFNPSTMSLEWTYSDIPASHSTTVLINHKCLYADQINPSHGNSRKHPTRP